jgi:hypothetical protein
VKSIYEALTNFSYLWFQKPEAFELFPCRKLAHKRPAWLGSCCGWRLGRLTTGKFRYMTLLTIRFKGGLLSWPIDPSGWKLKQICRLIIRPFLKRALRNVRNRFVCVFSERESELDSVILQRKREKIKFKLSYVWLSA